MVNTKLKNRDIYLKKLISFKDTDPIKVITGIRRCGKSKLLELMIEYLKKFGIAKSQILKINFESYEFRNMTEKQFYEYVKSKIVSKKKMYLFFDELQKVKGWENVVNSLKTENDCDIYITGSNAYLLSTEYSTYLSGRYIEIKMLPLSFGEFINFYGFKIKKNKNSLGKEQTKLYNDNDEQYDINDMFNTYLIYGGMPGISDIGLDQEKVNYLLDGIYTSVVVKDILQREIYNNSKKITDSFLLEKIILFLADNIGNTTSLTSIANTLENVKLIKKQKHTKSSVNTISDYVDALLKSYFFYEIKRYDIKGKEYLKTLGKYYMADIGFRNYLLGLKNIDRGHILENIIYLELLRRNYNVYIGKIDTFEIDFIAANVKETIYIQVTESITSKNVLERELNPLNKVSDNYEKIILSMDKNITQSYDGIKVKNIIDWLLEI